MNYINDFSNKDQTSKLTSSQWMVGFRNRFLLRLLLRLLLRRPGHSDLGFLSAEWSSFTKRTGKSIHPSHVLRVLSQKVGVGSLNLSRLRGLPLPGPAFWITAPGPPCPALLTATLPRAETTAVPVWDGAPVPPGRQTWQGAASFPHDSRCGTPARSLQSFGAGRGTMCLGYPRQGRGCLTQLCAFALQMSAPELVIQGTLEYRQWRKTDLYLYLPFFI